MNSVELLVEIIKEHAPEDIWQDSPLIGYRLLGNTNRGEIGEEFICRYLRAAGIEATAGGRVAATDITIGEFRFEVKTASSIMCGWIVATTICFALGSVRRKLCSTCGGKERLQKNAQGGL